MISKHNVVGFLKCKKSRRENFMRKDAAMSANFIGIFQEMLFKFYNLMLHLLSLN